LPRPLRRHFYHIYAFCRWSDDLGDEIDNSGQSLDLLSWWRQEILDLYAGQTRHPILLALQETISQFQIPSAPFLDLISAFEQDQRFPRYETFAQLLDYCRRSANPVGRLVLYLFRQCELEKVQLSDEICTGLQLVNFWQDLRRDFAKGRIYLPWEEVQRFDCEQMFSASDSSQVCPSFRDLIRFQAERTAGFFQRGRKLLDLLPFSLRSEIELIILGGERLLQRIAAVDYDTWTTRPALSTWTQTALLTRALWNRWRPRLAGR
jgi:squalene synthase HpnC